MQNIQFSDVETDLDDEDEYVEEYSIYTLTVDGSHRQLQFVSGDFGYVEVRNYDEGDTEFCLIERNGNTTVHGSKLDQYVAENASNIAVYMTLGEAIDNRSPFSF